MRNHLTPINVLVILVTLITFSCAQTTESNHNSSASITVLPEYVFTPSANISSQVEKTLAIAKKQNKQALFVIGAQWCHDSKGLAQRFSTPQMQKILTKNYQVLFVDAGYLEKGFDVVEQFNIPVYYGTPTVMIIEPNSAKVLNKASMQKWLNADKVPLHEYVEYFDNFDSLTTANKKPIEASQSMQAYLTEINNFERQQAIRLKAAYGVIGPLLKQYIESDNKKDSGEFSNKWEQVHDLRYRIQNDIQALMAQAKSNVAAGTSAPLTLPTYPAFTWE